MRRRQRARRCPLFFLFRILVFGFLSFSFQFSHNLLYICVKVMFTSECWYRTDCSVLTSIVFFVAVFCVRVQLLFSTLHMQCSFSTQHMQPGINMSEDMSSKAKRALLRV